MFGGVTASPHASYLPCLLPITENLDSKINPLTTRDSYFFTFASHVKKIPEKNIIFTNFEIEINKHLALIPASINIFNSAAVVIISKY